MKIVAINGSIRQGSFNGKLIDVVKEKCPDDITFEMADISELPLFNEDLETSPPDRVIAFKEQLANADILLFATPNYNSSIPGVLKNAIDWASRSYDGHPNSLGGKVGMIVGATPGMSGTLQAQLHLAEILSVLNVLLAPQPRVMVSNVNEKINEEGKLVLDDMNAKALDGLLSRTIDIAKTR